MSETPADARPVYETSVFLTLLTREAGRASRYRDFFGLCLLTPDRRRSGGAVDPAGLHSTIAERVRARLSQTDPVSIGLASFPRDGTDAHALLDRARALMEQARHDGGDRVRDADHAE